MTWFLIRLSCVFRRDTIYEQRDTLAISYIDNTRRMPLHSKPWELRVGDPVCIESQRLHIRKVSIGLGVLIRFDIRNRICDESFQI